MQPEDIHVCTGTQEENDRLLALCRDQGTLQYLNPDLRPNWLASPFLLVSLFVCELTVSSFLLSSSSFFFFFFFSVLARTDPADVARAEKDTFICSAERKDAGPTNNWREPAAMMAELRESFSGCMRGRTLYVVPFSMGPLDSPFAKLGVELTDSAFVVANMRIMTRMGQPVLDRLAAGQRFVKCVHSVGRPLTPELPADAPARSAWPCHIAKRRVVHFMRGDDSEIWSFGSGYGGNSLLGKKCFALRVASVMGRSQGWLAEHMLILGITNPQGVKRYICAAFPSACGKTNLAMMEPSLPGWKVEVVGDDIAWLRFGPDGRLYAINPEYGFFGVAPGTSMSSNPNAMRTLTRNCIFTNVAQTADNDVWWEGMSKQPPAGRITDWKGNEQWSPTAGTPAAHPNSRFTAPLSQCPVLDDQWECPHGVPIDAIIFGGRRKDTTPLVFESFSWQHGTFLGAAMRSQATAAADQKGLVFDPMAMKPFIGYNVKDYWQHWLDMAQHPGARLPKIFHVNWFRKSAADKFLWPGFGENARVLKWILGRVDGAADAVTTPIGRIPGPDALDLSNLPKFDKADLDPLLAVRPDEWQAELADLKHHFHTTLMQGDPTPMPPGILAELSALEDRLANN